MRDFRNNRRGNDNRGGGNDFRRRDFDRPHQMFKTICSNCGKECEVPFKPSGDKPVFCRECFQNNRQNDNRGDRRDDRRNDFQRKPNFERRNNERNENSDNEQFQALNSKLDKIIELLTPKKDPEFVEAVKETKEPSAAKPVKAKKKKVAIIPEELTT